MRNPAGGVSKSTNKTTPCCTKVGLKRGPWTPEEDELLANYIRREGEGRWRTLPKRAGLLRCGKSCRLRWMNYLRPSVKRGQIAPDEEDLILRLHRLLGNRWSLIAGRIPGRTDNEIKNYWNTHLSKKLVNQGIDPRTHKPLVEHTNYVIQQPHAADPANNMINANSLIISKPNYNNNNNPPAPNLSIEEEEELEARMNINSSTSPMLIINNSLDHHRGNGTGYTNLLVTNTTPTTTTTTCDNTTTNGLMSLRGIIGGGSSHMEHHQLELEDDHDINYSCAGDDVFSSFLNSLINEDAFANHQYHQQSINNHHVQPNSDNNLNPIATALKNFGIDHATNWEVPLISSSTNALSQIQPNQDIN